mgnify:CR=1 FL=1
MKKIICIIIAGLLAVSCSDKEVNNTNKTSVSESPKVAEVETFKQASSPEELLDIYKESLSNNDYDLMWSLYDIEVGEFAKFNNELKEKVLPFLNLIKNNNYVYDGGDGMFADFISELSEFVFLTEIEDNNLVRFIVFPPKPIIEKLGLKPYEVIRNKIRDALVASKIAEVKIYDKKPDSPQFGKVLLDMSFEGKANKVPIGIVKNTNSSWKIHDDFITWKFKSKAGLYSSNLEKIDNEVVMYQITQPVNAPDAKPSDALVFKLYQIAQEKKYSIDVYYSFISNQCIQKVQSKKDDFSEEYIYWNCLLKESHKSIYGQKESEKIVRLRVKNGLWVTESVRARY